MSNNKRRNGKKINGLPIVSTMESAIRTVVCPTNLGKAESETSPPILFSEIDFFEDDCDCAAIVSNVQQSSTISKESSEAEVWIAQGGNCDFLRKELIISSEMEEI
jgi:hypothetical protein